ncbi:hypothetical protein PV325_000355, partial [Microctonus aethiopoides]
VDRYATKLWSINRLEGLHPRNDCTELSNEPMVNLEKGAASLIDATIFVPPKTCQSTSIYLGHSLEKLEGRLYCQLHYRFLLFYLKMTDGQNCSTYFSPL